MSTTLALERLYTTVSAELTSLGVPVANVFGWRAVARAAPEHMRIAWVPGDPSGGVGQTGAARNPGTFPRPLALLRELFTVYIHAADASAPENELAQYHLARLLRDAWLRSVYRAAHGTFTMRAESWVTDKLERRFGATLRIICEIEAPALDALPDELTAALDPNAIQDANEAQDIAALIDAQLTDVTESGGSSPQEPSDMAGVQTTANKYLPALATSADGDLATSIAIAQSPSAGAFINVSVNGLLVTRIGNGSRANCEGYFSGDFGATARLWSDIQVGDTFHWNGSVAQYELAASDVLAFWYEQSGVTP